MTALVALTLAAAAEAESPWKHRVGPVTVELVAVGWVVPGHDHAGGNIEPWSVPWQFWSPAGKRVDVELPQSGIVWDEGTNLDYLRRFAFRITGKGTRDAGLSFKIEPDDKEFGMTMSGGAGDGERMLFVDNAMPSAAVRRATITADVAVGDWTTLARKPRDGTAEVTEEGTPYRLAFEPPEPGGGDTTRVRVKFKDGAGEFRVVACDAQGEVVVPGGFSRGRSGALSDVGGFLEPEQLARAVAFELQRRPTERIVFKDVPVTPPAQRP